MTCQEGAGPSLILQHQSPTAQGPSPKLDLCELAGKASGSPSPDDGSCSWFSLCAHPSLVWPVTLVCKKMISGEIGPGKKKKEREKRDRYQIGNENADMADPEDFKKIGRGRGGLNDDPGGDIQGLISGTGDLIWQSGFADVIRLRFLRWAEHSGLPGGPLT